MCNFTVGILHVGSPFHSSHRYFLHHSSKQTGIGQWNAWTRNFNSPLLALLDLFDNSVDAAMKPDVDDKYKGKIEVEADWWNRSYLDGSDSDGSEYEDIDGAPLDTITGVVITNNSHRPIKTLEKILEAYSSAKGREEHGEDHEEGEFAETIGENGVGLKQGCAVLSDLSFVLVRRGEGEASKFSMGFIARQLQREEGISLPSIEFDSSDLDSLKGEMISLFTGTAVGKCVATYGGDSLDAGVNRMFFHFQQMSSKANGGWGHFSEIFRLILHEVKGSSERNPNSRALALMDGINSALPSSYIHLPENVEVIVNGQGIRFNHYQSSLIELTAFYQGVTTSVPVGEGNYWQDPEKGNLPFYNIRLFFGFDASRKGGRPRLCIHSRYSGRLVKSVEDCRAILGLTTGSSDFCQGLTVIVDDMHAHLPLNPTKQDIAFGEQGEAGDVHRRNLFSWIGAYTSLFYSIHKNKFGGSKRALSGAISRRCSERDSLTWDGPSLDSCELTRYAGIEWKYIKATGNIRCGNLKKVSVFVEGKDTVWKLAALPPEVACAAHAPARSNQPPRKKRKLEQDHSVNDDGSLPVHDLMLPGSSLQAAVRVGLERERSPATSSTPTFSGDEYPSKAATTNPRSQPLGPDYKKLYEELKQEHEGHKKDHERLDKRYQDLRSRYEKKREYKKMAKEQHELLELERRRRKEELEEKEEDVREKDGIIERLKKKITRLEERIKSLDSLCSPQRRNEQALTGTRQVSL
jgi:hypothetical protein